jgi:hypothetical protein
MRIKVMSAIELHTPSLICCDGNLEPSVLCDTARVASNLNIPGGLGSLLMLLQLFSSLLLIPILVHFEPTSVPKSIKIFDDPATLLAGSFNSISPNQHELAAMSNTARDVLPEGDENYIIDKVTREQLKGKWRLFHISYTLSCSLIDLTSDSSTGLPDMVKESLPYAFHLSNYFRVIITKLGEHGCLITGQANGKPVLRYFKPHDILSDQIKSVTGAGDRYPSHLTFENLL